ncbi:chromosome condensation protein [Arabidopsis thaliana]|uniref:Structural maintenance of chromosomes protein 4 n=1 Tax=Arabidopsis thaliana TaxID=3702 RepID=SMC4_ARATH|nr:structural maintenance of chromosome 3 [Arabidopsis thaliana]Q9FJL0.1 RecName: Full=Structural maintenance of chromosomes protein 4; Short=AtSMC4; Short=SMC protein 4; Short=SMC-4; AltName: Full=Chromosome-associated protein C; Short=AtCAP-C [Arabidopsis thaliana]AED95694.1 structural maintenance of chromosome 3 [Arabidopsis thaliana]BAB10693.1 chromosome condensation protein [Arabidopsis thaliana]|eukprot:NP_199671.1 structural maintenance of chromosome 3 [Arabidopsis thaliana]
MEEDEPMGGGESEPEQRKSGTPRLYIKELVMRNFKSYAGEQRVGPFHKSFSAVVGPNGSGKSNVIDAMLFVFGKRAKQMRLNKVSELIHNSTNHQNLDSAGVSVQFEEIIDLENGLYETVPGSDFMITRVAFRDNSSKYYINERSSNFTEVTKKLKGKGVDLDNNRFLILQGEVEQISLMKPKAQGPHDEGFLEYLEDIIGTNKYVEKIDELNKQLETLNESRSGVVQMVKLAEKERDNLEGLKDEAETYMLKELSHLKWQEKATKMAYEDTVAKITEQRDSLQNLENSLKDERVKMDESNEELKKFESVHEKHKKRQEVLDNELRACKEKFKEFERQDVKHREDLKHVKQKIKKLEDKLEKDSSKIGDMTKESEDSSNLIPKLQENIPKLQKVLLDEEKKLEEIKAIAKVETEGYRSELTKIRAELEPWEKDLIVHRGKLDVASSESELLSKKHEAALKAFTDAQKQLSDISTRKKEKAAATTSWKADIKKKKQEAIEARKVEEESLKEQETLVPQEQAAREKVAELKSAMNSEKSQNEVLKAVLRAKENNQIEGIYGRMGDLGAIDAKYDVAISTACAGLDYIVVETTSSAQACVELLRKGNLGFATFMILEKQTDHIHKLKEKVKTPEDVPRLFDLVRVKDERMKLAFYAALGNTVVAKDLDQATRIAYGGNREFRRVVALDGALFEKSGTMSGGGGKARGGRMGTSIRATGVSGEAVANAENELSKIVDMLNNIREKVGNAVRQYRAAENEVSGLEMELAKSQREIESLNSEHNYLEKQLASLEAASQPKTDEIDRLKELKKIISKEEKEIENLEKGSKQLKDKLQTNIENAGGEKLKGQKAKVEKIQTDIDKNNTEINRCNVQIETNQKLIKKLTKGIEEATREKERLEGEKENLHVTFKDITQKAFEIQETYKKTQQLIDEHKDVLTGAKSDYENLKKSVDELKASRVDAEFKVQDMKKKYNELEMREKGYKKKLNDLQIAFTKHMEQIQKDLVDPDKLQATLMDNNLNEACDLKRALEMVALLEAQLKELNPNLDSIAEYRSKVELYNGRVDELNSVTQERDDTRKQYDELRKRRLDEFMAGFNTISLKLKEMYQMITLGGDAELELVDSLDPFSEGVVFSVRPPKKSWKNIANLSGGEKTLSSLALVFALHHYKPTPLYVMDEIDAALDFKNVSIVGHYVKDRTKDAQFIIISLRNNMFELADRLVGIYKTDNCTKSITINPGSFAVCQKTPA